MLSFLLLLSLVSAGALDVITQDWKWDNQKVYNPVEKKAQIYDYVGGNILDAKLVTGEYNDRCEFNPKTNHIKCPLGYGLTHVFKINTYEDYKNLFGNTRILDLKNKGVEINREGDFKVLSYETFEVPVHEIKLKLSKNGSKYYDSVIVGYKNERKKVWSELKDLTFVKGKEYVVGYFTKVSNKEKIDVIPNMAGRDIEEWATVSGDVSTGLMAYFSFDEQDTTGSGTITNEVGSDGTNNGATNSTGFLGTAYYCDGSDDYIDLGSDTQFNNSDYSFSFWIKGEPENDDTRYFSSKDTTDGTSELIFQYRGSDESNELRFDDNRENSGSDDLRGGYINGTWSHFVLTSSKGSNMRLYHNGLNVANGTAGVNDIVIPYNIFLCARNDAGSADQFFKGWIDELAMYNRTLTTDEVALLFNELDGIPYSEESDTNNPVVTLDTPVNDTSYTASSRSTNFKCKATDDVNLDNITFYLYNATDDTVEYTDTNTDGDNNTLETFITTIYGGTNYTWNCLAYDNSSNSAWASENYTVIIYDTVDSSPNVSIGYNSPPDNAKYSLWSYESSALGWVYSPLNFSFNCSNIYDDIKLDNVSLVINTVTYNTTTDPSNNSNVVYNNTFDDGSYDWYCIVYDNASQSFSTPIRTFDIDSTFPYVSNQSGLTDLAVAEFPFNQTWSYNASDTNINECHYSVWSYQGLSLGWTHHYQNVTVTCNSTINTEWDRGEVSRDLVYEYCANDTFNQTTCNFKTVSITALEYVQEDDPDPIADGFTVTFSLNVSASNYPVDTIPNIDAFLIFNDTAYHYDRKDESLETQRFEVDIIVPSGWGNTTGVVVDWYWNYSATGLSDLNFSTNTSNVTIYAIDIDDCSSYNDTILSLSLYDEENNTFVNSSLGSTIELDLQIKSSENTSVNVQYNNTWTDQNNATVCVPDGLLGTYLYLMDYTIGFTSTDRVWEFYYLDNGTLDNTKQYNSLTNNNTILRDLQTSDSTSFLFNYFDQTGLPVDDTIVHVFRKYIGSGLFREVERAKSDDNGDTVVHLVEEDVIYYFVVTQYGNILYTTSQYTALCQTTPCTLQFEEDGSGAEFPTDWDLVDDGGFSISSNSNTRKVSLTYTQTGADRYNFSVYRINGSGDYSLLNTTSSVSTSDTLELFIPQTSGNYTFFATVHKDGEFLKSEYVDFEYKPQDVFGLTLSLFLAFLLILTFALMGATEGGATIILVIFGVFISGALGLINTSLSTGLSVLIYLIISGGFLLWKLSAGRR